MQYSPRSLTRRVLKDSVVERYGLGTEEKRRLEEDERIKQLVKDVITRAVVSPSHPGCKRAERRLMVYWLGLAEREGEAGR